MARHTGGWVKLWRKAALGDIGSNYTRGGMFGAIIAMANIQASKVSWQGKPRDLERGEIVTSMTELASLGEVDRSTVLRHLNYLVLRGTVTLEKSNRGILLKIVNYEQYQGVDASGPHRAQQQPHIRHNNSTTHNEERKNKRSKDSPSAPHPLATFWNSNTKNLAQVKGTSGKRLALCLKHQDDYDEPTWVSIFKKADASPFLTGQNKNGWAATFDWVLKNANRIDEGEFSDRLKAVPGSGEFTGGWER